MKTLISFLLVVALTGCGTLGGAISGAGRDLSRAGDWVQSK
jgi:predicted small secreted protein